MQKYVFIVKENNEVKINHEMKKLFKSDVEANSMENAIGITIKRRRRRPLYDEKRAFDSDVTLFAWN